MTTRKSSAAVAAVPDPTDEDRGDMATDPPDEENLNEAVVVLDCKGTTFTIPKRRGRWPIRAARELGRDNHVEAIVALIGEVGWAQLEELIPVVDDLEEWANYVGEKIKAECVP